MYFFKRTHAEEQTMEVTFRNKVTINEKWKLLSKVTMPNYKNPRQENGEHSLKTEFDVLQHDNKCIYHDSVSWGKPVYLLLAY